MEQYKSWLGKKVNVIIDRPLGSAHPEYPAHIYPINSGYIPGTISEIDHEEVDAYVLGPTKPLHEFQGVVIAVVVRDNHEEYKLVVTADERIAAEAIEREINFQEKYYTHTLIMSDVV